MANIIRAGNGVFFILIQNNNILNSDTQSSNMSEVKCSLMVSNQLRVYISLWLIVYGSIDSTLQMDSLVESVNVVINISYSVDYLL